MADLIDRQAAIDAVEKHACNTQRILDAIYALPSTESEIIRCKDCKWFGDIGCAMKIVDDSDKPTENDFCSFAERRTDE